LSNQQQVQWSPSKVGVLILVALSALTALIFFMSGNTGGFFTGHITIRSYFENAAGLKEGAPVNLEGYTVGSVTKIGIVPARKLTPVEVTFRIGAKYRDAVRTDSTSSLEIIGVLGDTAVDINSKIATGPPVEKNAELKTSETPSLSDVIKSSQGTIEQVNTILVKVDHLADSLSAGKGSLGKFINDPPLLNKANDTATKMDALMTDVSQGKGSLGELFSPAFHKKVNASVDDVNQLIGQVQHGHGTLGRLINDPSLRNNLKQDFEQARTLRAEVSQGRGTLGKLVNGANHAVATINTLRDRIVKGEGSLRLPSTNAKPDDNRSESMQTLREFLTDFRENPKKYLTLHIRSF
jgi:phospholipid/cholesterol/gamma-HCH transport system substrate-binding protein